MRERRPEPPPTAALSVVSSINRGLLEYVPPPARDSPRPTDEGLLQFNHRRHRHRPPTGEDRFRPRVVAPRGPVPGIPGGGSAFRPE